MNVTSSTDPETLAEIALSNLHVVNGDSHAWVRVKDVEHLRRVMSRLAEAMPKGALWEMTDSTNPEGEES